MKTLHFELDFQTGELVSPVARIYVKSFSENGADGHKYITQDCALPQELDYVIDNLKRELDVLRTLAHAKFAAAHP